MKRPDSDLIRRLIKSGALNHEKGRDHRNLGEAWTFEKIMRLPYFYLSHKEMKDFDFTVPNQMRQRAEFVYDEFVLSAKSEVHLRTSDSSVETIPANYWGVVKAFNDGTNCSDALTLFIEYPEHPRQVLVWEGWAESNNNVEGDGYPDNVQGVEKIDMVMASDYEKYMSEWYQWMIDRGTISGEGGFERFISGITDQASNWYLFICKLMNYIKYGDKHVVEVTPTPDRLAKAKRNPVNRKRPWAKSSGPHVLLLDRMPTEKTEPTGTHASPKPHRRRGYWKTLRDPRFRHHPQYQKKIFVKPCFVGDKQVTYEGNIYRLVEPLEDEV